MIKILLPSLLVLNSLLLNAQGPEEAEKLLNEVSTTIASFENMSFDFTYILENRTENIRQETNGSAVLSDDRYKINFLGNEQIFDGNTTYTIVPENEEVTISNSEEDADFGINPKELLVFYKSGYAYQWDIRQNIKGRRIQFVKLIPSKENKDLKYLLLGIDMRTKIIYRLIEVGKGDTRTTLTLKNIKTNIQLAADLFTFNASKYPDYYINN